MLESWAQIQALAVEGLRNVEEKIVIGLVTQFTHAEWTAEAEQRFGKDPLNWKFKCPCCGYVASVKDWKAAGASSGVVAFSCVGRYRPEGMQRDAFKGRGSGPCNYAGGGLFGLNPVRVLMPDGKTLELFEFADKSEES